MDPLRSAISRLAGDLIRDRMKRGMTALSLWTLAFVLLLVAIGFAISGIYAAIEAPLGPIAARFIVAAGVLVFALLLIVSANRSLRRGRKSRGAAMDGFAGDHPDATSVGNVAAAFAFGLVQGLIRRRKS